MEKEILFTTYETYTVQKNITFDRKRYEMYRQDIKDFISSGVLTNYYTNLDKKLDELTYEQVLDDIYYRKGELTFKFVNSEGEEEIGFVMDTFLDFLREDAANLDGEETYQDNSYEEYFDLIGGR